MADYAIYLSYNNEQEVIQLPILPESIEVTEAGSNKTYNIVGLGEINVLKDIKLTEISLDSFFPATWSPIVSVPASSIRAPLDYINTIQKWRKEKEKAFVRFVFTGLTVDINMLVSIEKFIWKESGGAVGDIEYQLSLKKYVPYAAKKVVVQPASSSKMSIMSVSSQPPRQDTKPQQKTYTLVSGDNLWKVAQKFLGNGARWGEIQKLNNISDAQLKRLPVGMALKIPG